MRRGSSERRRELSTPHNTLRHLLVAMAAGFEDAARDTRLLPTRQAPLMRVREN